jgi:hypothetical protein
MKLYFIRQKSTGHYMVAPTGRGGRGGSHCQPSANTDLARIFRSERSAKLSLNAWLKGKWVAYRGMDPGHPGNDWEAYYYEDISIIPVPERDATDMEIVMREVCLD